MIQGALKNFLQFDHDFSRRLRIAERPGRLRIMAAFLAHSGDSWFWLLALGIVWLVGNEYWKTRALILGGSILVTAVLVMGIKFSVRRARPSGEWGAIYRSTDPHSFPSGHSTRAFLLAVLALGLGPAWLGALLIIWAPLVTLARVAMGVHYLSDVIAGGGLGIVLGLIIILCSSLV
jgi:undecaprenyl-diphosphatase